MGEGLPAEGALPGPSGGSLARDEPGDRKCARELSRSSLEPLHGNELR
jgi:hypothetical protein